MLLTQEHLKKIKQVNVSKNADKTKERVQQDFKAASKKERKAIIELSGQVSHSIYRVYATGSVNARIVLALAQILNVQPWYYTGEIDEKVSLEDNSQILKFLEVHGYDKLLKEINESKPLKRKYNRKPKVEASVEQPETPIDVEQPETPIDEENCKLETEASIEVKLLFTDEPQMKKAIAELTEQEAIELLHTLFIRAKGGGEASHIAEVVKRCLLK